MGKVLHWRPAGYISRSLAFTGAPARCRKVVTHSANQQAPKGVVISEEVLAKLKAAEEEAARLRKELAAAQGQVQQVTASKDVIEATPKRIDGTGRRETLGIVNVKRNTWLTESDVDFFTGGAAPGETADTASALTPEEQATVQRRLLIGGTLTAALAAFALVPTEKLRPRPSKPMYFYIVPLLRTQDLLIDCKDVINDADWDTLRLALARIRGSPNRIQESLDNVVAWIEDARTAEKAQKQSSELVEYLDAMDYNKYFDAIPSKVITPTQNAEFVKFSSQALKAAQERLNNFLALLPADQVETAKAQVQSAL